MIEAKEARIISISAELDKHILDNINKAIVTEAGKGNYVADITYILPEICPNVTKYYDYFKELGFKIYTLYKGECKICIGWN